MLFAVEGGGFFSSSATGYSKGLALLLLGQRTEEKPIRLSPWYQLVDQDPKRSKKKQSCSCTSFVCFHRKSKTRKKSEASVGSLDQERVRNSDSADESDVKVFLKSSLRKSIGQCDENSCLEDEQSNVSCRDRRKIHWTDAYGRDLAEIREFEPSEKGLSDDELESDGARRCQCVIQ